MKGDAVESLEGDVLHSCQKHLGFHVLVWPKSLAYTGVVLPSMCWFFVTMHFCVLASWLIGGLSSRHLASWSRTLAVPYKNNNWVWLDTKTDTTYCCPSRSIPDEISIARLMLSWIMTVIAFKIGGILLSQLKWDSMLGNTYCRGH